MKRRDMLGIVGTAAGLAGIRGAAGAAADHDHAADKDPADAFHLYLCAFHIAKKDPTFVVEAHHYCSPVADEVHFTGHQLAVDPVLDDDCLAALDHRREGPGQVPAEPVGRVLRVAAAAAPLGLVEGDHIAARSRHFPGSHLRPLDSQPVDRAELASQRAGGPRRHAGEGAGHRERRQLQVE